MPLHCFNICTHVCSWICVEVMCYYGMDFQSDSVFHCCAN